MPARSSKYDEVMQFGAKHGYLTSLGLTLIKGKQRHYLLQCECGTMKWMSGRAVSTGVSRSCGCFARKQSAVRCASRATHGLSRTPVFASWRNMMCRCYEETNNRYKHYGGRGIKVCDRWHDLALFESDMGPTYFKGATIDRKDANGDYCPENVRWATQKDQQRNRTNNRLITYQGRTQCLSAWAEEYGLTQKLLRQRLDRDNKSFEEAIKGPRRDRQK